MGTESRCAGYLVGHTEGITCVSSKGDGRYLLSNGKDQTTKLWDVRKTKTSYDEDNFRIESTSWDYRWMPYPNPSPIKHPDDQSARTYVGHVVNKTLIRCYFSPPSTNHRFAYTGSADGNVYIYDIEGDGVTKVVVSSEEEAESFHPYRSYSLVRDLSWHPHLPFMVAGQWTEDGGNVIKIQPF
jgi:WD repeat-containing protein 23